jgi:proliferating cell nuclear antigen
MFKNKESSSSSSSSTNTNIDYDKYVLFLSTVQIQPFRTLMTALKEILTETNITFKPDGMHIINMDKSHTVLVSLDLPSVNFQEFFCKKDKIIIGVNMFHLFKLINTIDNDDILSIYIETADYADGIVSHLGLKFENGDIKQCKTQKLRLIEPDHEELVYPDVKFSSIINLPSTDFQKIVRDFSNISEKIEIKSVGNELIFKCQGQFASAEIHRAESDGNLEYVSKQDNTKIISGEYSLKNLSYFIKCTNLCPMIELYMENNLPLVCSYKAAALGEILLCLANLPSGN